MPGIIPRSYSFGLYDAVVRDLQVRQIPNARQSESSWQTTATQAQPGYAAQWPAFVGLSSFGARPAEAGRPLAPKMAGR
jgi:hypothetical protein